MNKSGAVNLLQDHLKSRGKSPHTIRAYCSDLNQYFDWVADNYPVDDSTWHENALRPRIAQTYINEMRHSVSASTVNRRISSIRGFAKTAKMPDPLLDYDGPKRTKAPAHPLPGLRDDLEALVAQARTCEQACIVALCGMVGLRIEEARSIRVSSIGHVKGTPYLRVRGKGDKQRDVPIGPRPMELVQQRINELGILAAMSPDRLSSPDPKLIQYSDRGARAAYTAMGRRAGIETATHDLRMTFGTLVYGGTLDIRVTQELLGHADISTTVGYTRVADKAKVAAVGVFA